MLLNDQDLRYVMTIFKRMEEECYFIKKYCQDFPGQHPRLVTILADIKKITEEEAVTYIRNIMV